MSTGLENRISKEATAEYADNLVHLASDIRKEFKRPNLPIVVVQSLEYFSLKRTQNFDQYSS